MSILVLGMPAIYTAVFVAFVERHRELERRSLDSLDETMLYFISCAYMLLVIICYIGADVMAVSDVPLVSLGWVIFFLIAYKPAVALMRRMVPKRQ